MYNCKYVLYNDFFKGICGTPEFNYNARIRNDSLITRYNNFSTMQDAKKSILQYTTLREEDIIIIE